MLKFSVVLVALVALVASPAAWALPKMTPQDKVVPEEGFYSELQQSGTAASSQVLVEAAVDLRPESAFTQQPPKDQSMDYLARERSQVQTLSEQLKGVAHDVPVSGLMQSHSLSQQQMAAVEGLTTLANQYQGIFDINARPFLGSQHGQATDAIIGVLDRLQQGLDAAEHSINSTLVADMGEIDREYDIAIARAAAGLETRTFKEVFSGTCSSNNMKPVETADCVLAAMVLDHKYYSVDTLDVAAATEPLRTTSADYPLGCIYSSTSETLVISSGIAELLESQCSEQDRAAQLTATSLITVTEGATSDADGHFTVQLRVRPTAQGTALAATLIYTADEATGLVVSWVSGNKFQATMQDASGAAVIVESLSHDANSDFYVVTVVVSDSLSVYVDGAVEGAKPISLAGASVGHDLKIGGGFIGQLSKASFYSSAQQPQEGSKFMLAVAEEPSTNLVLHSACRTATGCSVPNSGSSGTAALAMNIDAACVSGTCDTMGGAMFDNDLCLQQSTAFGASDTCADSAHLCSSYDRDMHRCCSKTCGVPTACSINVCNALQGEGDCSGLPVDCGSTVDGSQFNCFCQTPFDNSDMTPSCGALGVCADHATISAGTEACYNSATASAVCEDFTSSQGWCSSMSHCIQPLTLAQGTAIAREEKDIHSDAAVRKREESWDKLTGEQAAVTGIRHKVSQLGLPVELTQQASDLLQEAAAGPLLSSRHYKHNNSKNTIQSLLQHIEATISREEESRRISALVVKWNLN